MKYLKANLSTEGFSKSKEESCPDQKIFPLDRYAGVYLNNRHLSECILLVIRLFKIRHPLDDYFKYFRCKGFFDSSIFCDLACCAMLEQVVDTFDRFYMIF